MRHGVARVPPVWLRSCEARSEKASAWWCFSNYFFWKCSGSFAEMEEEGRETRSGFGVRGDGWVMNASSTCSFPTGVLNCLTHMFALSGGLEGLGLQV